MKLPRACAVYKEGILYWRLGLLCSELDADDILKGVSSDFSAHGLELKDESGTLFRDDALTEGELEFLAGTYRIYTGE